MSEPSPQAPFIGSHISLISKSGIRYEGRLYAVDAKEESVTLESVRCYGTEDREVDVHFPPNNEIYEYIKFSGNDIKDLNVIDVNPAEKPVPQDPAIMQMGPPRPPQSFGYYPDPNSSRFDNSFEFPGDEYQQPVTVHAQHQGKSAQGRSRRGGQQQQQQQPQQVDASKPFDGPGTGSFLKRGKDKPDNAEALSGEFDFQSSNARFDKDQFLSTLSKAQQPEQEPAPESLEGLGLALESIVKIKPAYDKTKSFFDEISTDRDNPTQYKEKVSNVETFGESAQSYRSFDYRRGRGRGGHRRGGPRHNNNQGQGYQGGNNNQGQSHQGGNNQGNQGGHHHHHHHHHNNNNNNNAPAHNNDGNNKPGRRRGGGGGGGSGGAANQSPAAAAAAPAAAPAAVAAAEPKQAE